MSTGQRTPKVGGSPRTMFVGMGVVAGGLLAFYFYQFRVHNKDDHAWITRHAQGSRLTDSSKFSAPITQPSASLPLPGNDKSGSAGVAATVMSVVLGRGINPDPSVPKEPGNMPVPTPQRRNSDGSCYTKAGNYAESYKKRPEDPSAPKEGRS